MGNLLSEPVTEKFSERHELNGLRIGASAMQGYRPEMEDQHRVASLASSSSSTLIAVFDGHGGAAASRICADVLLEHVTRALGDKDHSPTSLSEALHTAFISIDEHLREMRQQGTFESSGTTANVSIVSENVVITANVGDSRGILASAGNKVSALSEDHKPSNLREKSRIESAGGYVVFGRVDGSLAMSRALGDFIYKDTPNLKPDQQKVIAVPDIVCAHRSPQDEFVVMACDGIWDVMSNQQVATFVRDCLSHGEKDPVMIAEDLMDTCLDLGSKDNMTAVVVLFEGAVIGHGPGIAARRKQREQERMMRGQVPPDAPDAAAVNTNPELEDFATSLEDELSHAIDSALTEENPDAE